MDDLQRVVLVHLSGRDGDRFGEAYFIGPLAHDAGAQTTDVWAALWGLMSAGMVYLDPSGQGSGTDNWRWKATALGRTLVAGGTWEPADPSNYLARLRASDPPVEAISLAYVAEALSAFNARCYLATSVMLGVASEHAVLRLGEAVKDALRDRSQQLAKALEDPRGAQYKVFVETRKLLETRRGALPDGLADNLTLDAVADLLRVSRNSVGHPSGHTVDEDTAYTHLQMAARYLQKMARLRAHILEHGLP